MKLRYCLFALLCSVLLVSAASAQVQSLDGDWKYLPYNGADDFSSPAINDSNWPSMRLPSNWFLMGSKNYPANAKARIRTMGKSNESGALNDLVGDEGLDYNGTVWYRREINWSKTSGNPVILDLDMVDYYADVFVNGKHVGYHEGYFQKWSVDITSALKPGKNLIALKVSAPEQVYDMAQRFPISWPKSQNQIKGIFAYHDTRPGATSIHGQERSTGGVIRGITLRQSSGVDIVNVRVLPLEVSESSATLQIEATLRNWTRVPRSVALSGEVTPSNFESNARVPYTASVMARPGVSVVTTKLQVNNPALWWSWDYGKQNLYKLKAHATAGGATLDQTTVRFGIRTVTHDKDWVWYLNGKRIYLRGSNYIATQWLSQADKAWYDRDVRLMREANLNTIRIHAHLERPEFYEATDEQGILVWQDFPLQWGYTDFPGFHQEALKQAADMINRFADYPSIFLWCMHNESPYAMDWIKKRDPKQNLDLDNKLVALAARMDASRVAHRDSGTGDGHYYPGWYETSVGEFARRKFKEKTITEYGAQALPDVDTLKKIFDSEAIPPANYESLEAWKFANFQPVETAKVVEQGRTIEDFVRNSQLYQAQLTRFATEEFRRRKYEASTGIYHFMFVDDWPSITWSVLDYYRKPKLGFTALQTAMQPILPSIDYEIDEPDKPLAIYVVNDSYRNLQAADVCWTLGGNARACRTIDIQPDSVVKVTDLGPLPAVTRGSEKLEVTIVDNGAVVGHNSLSAQDFVLHREGTVASK